MSHSENYEEKFAEYGQEALVPKDFPCDPFPAALGGAQMKFAARLVNDRYVVGLTKEEREERYLMCEDMVVQLTAYVERKQTERKDLTLPQLLDGIDKSIRQKGWDIGHVEFDWVMRRLRARFPESSKE